MTPNPATPAADDSPVNLQALTPQERNRLAKRGSGKRAGQPAKEHSPGHSGGTRITVTGVMRRLWVIRTYACLARGWPGTAVRDLSGRPSGNPPVTRSRCSGPAG